LVESVSEPALPRRLILRAARRLPENLRRLALLAVTEIDMRRVRQQRTAGVDRVLATTRTVLPLDTSLKSATSTEPSQLAENVRSVATPACMSVSVRTASS